jgi:plasmid replication initiation protein
MTTDLVPALDDRNLADNIVSKSNALVRASFKLTLQEQRLVLLAISKLDSRKSHLTPRNSQTKVKITSIEFAETFGIDRKKAYEELRDATNELFERKITEINGKKTDKLRWVSRATYHDGEGWAELSLSPDILPMLTLLREKFTTYKLQKVANLRSTYSIRIFELCAQFSSTGLLRIDLDELIRLLDLPYTRYTDIVRRVISPAVEELRAKSNLDIEWRPIKNGRAVKTIEFTFQESAQGKLPLEE